MADKNFVYNSKDGDGKDYIKVTSELTGKDYWRHMDFRSDDHELFGITIFEEEFSDVVEVLSKLLKDLP